MNYNIDHVTLIKKYKKILQWHTNGLTYVFFFVFTFRQNYFLEIGDTKCVASQVKDTRPKPSVQSLKKTKTQLVQITSTTTQ